MGTKNNPGATRLRVCTAGTGGGIDMRWWVGCPFCPHPLMNHDGDGASEHYSCCNDDCACRWEWSASDAEADYEPLSLQPKGEPMADLTKTRTILTHSHSVERGPVFDAADEDGGRLTVLTLDESVWVDMGSPEQITVTIEPGDLLNVELDHHNMPLNEGFAADSTEHLVAALRAMAATAPACWRLISYNFETSEFGCEINWQDGDEQLVVNGKPKEPARESSTGSQSAKSENRDVGPAEAG